MNYISTTDLRTKSSELIATLQKGESVSLIHRSKVIGDITPKRQAKRLTKEDVRTLKRLAKELNLPRLSYKQRERRYRKHLNEKYVKGLS